MGHVPSLGAAQVFSPHWQQSLAPRVAVGVTVGPVGVGVSVRVGVAVAVPATGVNVAQVPALRHAA